MLAYQKLTEHYKNISHFSHLASICHWDQATMMPEGGNDARSNAMAALSLHLHQLSTDKNLEALSKKHRVKISMNKTQQT